MSGTASPSTSATLLRRLGETPQDQSAWIDFAKRYGPVIYLWCRQWRLQEADADDITQTVLLKLVDHMRDFRYDPSGSFRGWLRTVTYHVWAKFAGERQKRGQGAGGDAALEMLHTVEARDDLATRLEQEYDRELLDLAMYRVAQRVQPHTWEAFRLLAVEGRSGDEVAQRLNLRVATAYKARSKVQQMIQEELQRAGE